MHTQTTRLFLALVALSAVPAAQAVLLTSEAFNYTSSAAITGQNGGTGWRTSGGAYLTNGTTGTVASSGLTYSSAGYTTSPSSGAESGLSATLTAQRNNRFLQIDTGGVYDTNGYKSPTSNSIGGITGEVDNKTLYGSFLASSSNWSAARMIVEFAGASAIRLDQLTNGGAFTFADTGSGDLSANQLTPTGTNTYLLVYKINFSGTDNADNMTFWVNPTAGDTEASGGIALTAMRNINFTTLEIRSVAGNVVFDELRMGTTWADVAPVSAIPEPSTYAALAGLGALGLAALRRRRQAA